MPTDAPKTPSDTDFTGTPLSDHLDCTLHRRAYTWYSVAVHQEACRSHSWLQSSAGKFVQL